VRINTRDHARSGIVDSIYYRYYIYNYKVVRRVARKRTSSHVFIRAGGGGTWTELLRPLSPLRATGKSGERQKQRVDTGERDRYIEHVEHDDHETGDFTMIADAPDPSTYHKGKGLLREWTSLQREWLAGWLFLSFLRVAPDWMVQKLIIDAYDVITHKTHRA
jgi:hypothetical protein